MSIRRPNFPDAPDPANPYPLQPAILLKRGVSVDFLNDLSDKHCRTIMCRTGSDHHHPNLAVERFIAQETALSKMVRSGYPGVIHDAFGNDGCSQWRNVPHHSSMPIHHASDAVRQQSANPATSCQHEPDVCLCAQFSYVYFMQSVQYLSPERLADCIAATSSKVGVSIVHRFDGISGSFYGKEQTWFRSGSSSVTCTMDNGSTTWTHNSLDWLLKPYYLKHLGVVLESTMVASYGVTETWEHRLCLPRIERIAPLKKWDPASFGTQGDLYSLPHTFTGSAKIAYTLTQHQFTHKYIRVFPFVILFVGSEEEEVVLSTPIVSGLHSYLLGKEVNPATVKSLLNKAKSDYTKIPNLPSQFAPRAAMLSALLALNTSMKEFTPAFTEFIYNNSALIKAHNEALIMIPRFSMSGRTLVACMASTAVSCAVDYSYPTTFAWTSASNHSMSTAVSVLATHHVPLIVAPAMTIGPVVVTIPLVAAAWGVISMGLTVKWLYDLYGGNGHEDSIIRSWNETIPGEIPPDLPDVTHLKEASWFKPIDRVKKNVNLQPGTSITMTSIPPTEEIPRLTHTGIAMPVQPTHYGQTQENVVSAIANRLVMEVPQCAPGAWAHATALRKLSTNYKAYLDECHPITLNSKVVYDWARGKYSQARIEQLVKAFEEWFSEGFKMTKEITRYQCFLKVEKQVTPGVVDDKITEHDTKAPRSILAASDKMLSVCGPVYSILASRFKIGRLDEQGVAPSCCSIEDLADWLNASVELLGGNVDDLVCLDADGSKWDAHMREEALNAQFELLIKPITFTQPAIKNVLRPRVVTGTSRLGVKFNAGKVRATGEAATAVGNSELNLTQIIYILEKCIEKPGGLGVDYCAAVCGDDSFIVCKKSFLRTSFGTSDVESIKDQWIVRALRLGIDSTLNLREFGMGEFCSKWFYPVEENGQILYLLGGKIGRVLSKAGWSIDSPKEMSMYAAASGALKDNYHVPFLREYFRKVLQLIVKDPSYSKDRSPIKRFPWQYYANKEHDYGPPVWIFMEVKYGLCESDLVVFQNLLDCCQSLPVVINWHHFPRILAIDNA